MGRLAVDIGGTFTDLVHFDEESGSLEAEKSLSTPRDLTQGVLNTIDLSGIEPRDVSFFVHGGTTVINAITERKGVRTALVTTKGFRDVLEIARGNRPDMYNLRFQKPVAFVPRRRRFEVRERIDAQGHEIEPLEQADLEAVVEQCRKQAIEAIAVQFLHSYVAPEHEAACAAFLREKLPDVAVTASHEITREWREYERGNTAVLNAYVQPIVQRYFTKLEGALRELGIDCPFTAMQSNGGTTSFGWAKAHPITLIESGPAAGVNGAALIGELCGEPNVIYLDVGGTTVKCSVIEDGRPKVTTEYKLEWSRLNPGYPVRVPVADLVEIGAGGGSIARIDAAGSLRVGPQSAGADPGPACYGLGGSEPTVTDAKLLTGVLNPENFAGGRIALDMDRARNAMQTIADGLDTTVEDAAAAVIRVVEANMNNALKLVSIQRGHDPRDFVLGACAVEVLMLGDWRAAAGEVGFWPECGHLARPTLGWKFQTGRPERKRFAFHTRSMGTARPGASALAGQHLPQHVATVPIRLMFNAKHTRSHSPRTFAKPRRLNRRNPSTSLIHPFGASESHLRCAYRALPAGLASFSPMRCVAGSRAGSTATWDLPSRPSATCASMPRSSSSNRSGSLQ